ncbi:MFS transporter [Litoreibacter janthinus]|uniref:Predicted arabinose efflux permease, MFS family n=1 Tax=Litoreibacter janthinus TaxID=670154 RepID=A0A1I6H142_9RHOB|nr:MFS transporter [Litoreibacter janthinus]SFR48149.1 Predicted arabinose efflux permease, MFS family [Litoreibacter janthinus]
MFEVLKSSWALLLGMMLLMVGNGLQGSLIGVRGGIEGFSTFELSLITSGYFLGFLGGSRLAPGFIQRVGHVRVFAALGSFISATLILYPAVTDPIAWVILRVIIGFCFSGVYVTAESWLNNSSSNETRGQALSLYMIVQMVGIVAAQGLLNVADPGGFILFIIPSVLVSISFAPILLSVAPTPAFGTTRQLSFRDLFKVSPLGVIGMLLLGGVFSAQFGMSAVYGTAAGFSVPQISVFVSSIFVGAMILQYPIGWMSDRMDRRVLILWVSALACVAACVAWVFGDYFPVLLACSFVIGGMTNPLYSLLIAYTNDYLEPDDMAGASGGLLFVNGLGAIAGPVVTGWLMTQFGPSGFWLVIMVTMAVTTAYAAYRMTRRASAYSEEDEYEAVPYAAVGPGSTPYIAEMAQEYYVEAAEEIAEATDDVADETNN